MNKCCVALTDDEYRECISLLREGFMLKGRRIKPNLRIATIAVLQATLGLRLGDTLLLRLNSFVKDSDRWRLDIVEQKTGKVRTFTVPDKVYMFIQAYAYDMNISRESKLFDISARQVERHLNNVFTKMSLPLRKYGSHSFRKYFCVKVYSENEYDIVLAQFLMQHSSPSTTRRYISVSSKRVEDALAKTVSHIV